MYGGGGGGLPAAPVLNAPLILFMSFRSLMSPPDSLNPRNPPTAATTPAIADEEKSDSPVDVPSRRADQQA